MDFEHLANLDNKFLGGISLDDEDTMQYQEQGNSLNWVAKIESEELSCLNFESLHTKRIKEFRVMETIIKKYNEI